MWVFDLNGPQNPASGGFDQQDQVMVLVDGPEEPASVHERFPGDGGPDSGHLIDGWLGDDLRRCVHPCDCVLSRESDASSAEPVAGCMRGTLGSFESRRGHRHHRDRAATVDVSADQVGHQVTFVHYGREGGVDVSDGAVPRPAAGDGTDPVVKHGPRQMTSTKTGLA